MKTTITYTKNDLVDLVLVDLTKNKSDFPGIAKSVYVTKASANDKFSVSVTWDSDSKPDS